MAQWCDRTVAATPHRRLPVHAPLRLDRRTTGGGSGLETGRQHPVSTGRERLISGRPTVRANAGLTLRLVPGPYNDSPADEQ